MQKLTWLAFVSVILFCTSCKNNDFIKAKEGLEYKIISSGNGETVKYGQFIQMQIAEYLVKNNKDSLLQSRNSMPNIEVLDSTSIPPNYFKIFSQLRNGDSLVMRISMDSITKKNPNIPPYMKGAQYLEQTIRVSNIFKTREEADVARKAANEKAELEMKAKQAAQLKKDDVEINNYLKKNNITAVKAPLGTYVQIKEPGTGNNIDTSIVVKAFYTGRTMDGKPFDSNQDSSFQHTDPFYVNMTNDPSLGGVIPGWKDALPLLKKGSKATFFIPSTLAYGEQGNGDKIKPNSILIFDIEVSDLLNKEDAKKAMQELMKKMQERMQKSQPRQMPAEKH